MNIEKFKDVVENRHNYVQKWKEEKNGKVCGYLCGNVPEEILYAAKVLPVRIIGSHDPATQSVTHIPDFKCAFCRDCLNQALQGKYEYLDGLAYTTCCISTKMVFSSWHMHVPLEWKYDLWPVFCHNKPLAMETMVGQLGDFQTSLESWLGKKISDDELRESFDVYQKNRKLLTQVYELRKSNPPRIKGSDAKIIAMSSMLMDKLENNTWIEEYLESIPEKEQSEDEKVKVMIIGNGQDDLAVTDMVESLGGEVVIDDHCIGLRYFWNSEGTTIDGNPLVSIASYYIDQKPPCPSSDWTPEHSSVPRILGLAKEYHVECAIILAQTFCGQHQWELPDISAALEKEDIPYLLLEVDMTVPVGSLGMRIAALLEMVNGVVF